MPNSPFLLGVKLARARLAAYFDAIGCSGWVAGIVGISDTRPGHVFCSYLAPGESREHRAGFYPARCSWLVVGDSLANALWLYLQL